MPAGISEYGLCKGLRQVGNMGGMGLTGVSNNAIT